MDLAEQRERHAHHRQPRLDEVAQFRRYRHYRRHRHHRGEPPRRGERSFPQVRCGIYGDVAVTATRGRSRQVGPRRVGTVQRHRPAAESNQAPVYEMLRPTGEDGHTCDHEGQAGDGVDRLPEKPRAEPLAVEVGDNRFGVT